MSNSLCAPAPSENPLVRVSHLVKTYRTTGRHRVQALSDVSFSLQRGETLGVVGESGSGKSTLARAVLALPKPDAGEVVFDGQSLYEADSAKLRSLRWRMQMVFQDPMSSLNPAHRIIDIVEAPLLVAQRGDASSRRHIVMQTLHSVGLDGEALGARRSFELSGGQCQRVSIARALVLRPDLLICDEPVSALDVSVQAQVLNLLEDAKASFNLTMLFISHDLSVIKNISDRVMVMYLGMLCEIAPTDAIFARPRHPYTASLIAAVPSLVPSRRAPRVDLVRGEVPSPLEVPTGCRFRTRCSRASTRCATQAPPMTAVSSKSEHFVACHHPLNPD
jgi:peptide/nickel transport system ATP-binding protein